MRRTPEEARRVILDAALGLFATFGPDAIGLKDVAKEAGVSHALVTHYFGTYERLVEAAFAALTERSRAETIARIVEIASDGPRAWIEHAAEQISHPVYGRLAAWALLSGRIDADDFFPRKNQGFRKVADVVQMRLAYEGKGHVPRERVEFLILLVLSSLTGYAVMRKAMWGGLGKDATPERDAWFRSELSGVIEAIMERDGVPVPPARAKARRGSVLRLADEAVGPGAPLALDARAELAGADLARLPERRALRRRRAVRGGLAARREQEQREQAHGSHAPTLADAKRDKLARANAALLPDRDPARRARAEHLLTKVASRMESLELDFYDVGEALRELRDDKLYTTFIADTGVPFRSLESLLGARELMAPAMAKRLLAIVDGLSREEAVALGANRAFARVKGRR